MHNTTCLLLNPMHVSAKCLNQPLYLTYTYLSLYKLASFLKIIIINNNNFQTKVIEYIENEIVCRFYSEIKKTLRLPAQDNSYCKLVTFSASSFACN